ncbi:MAG: dodecin [Hyphomonadaceae bacterium]
MSDHIYKSLELTGTSGESIEKAVSNAIARASATVRNIKWFELGAVRGAVENGKVTHWQATMKIGFTLDD